MIQSTLYSKAPCYACMILILIFSNMAPVYSQSAAPWTDPSPHHASFVIVDKDVRLEVLDWGGPGKPLVLLAGFGNTAHVFDDFAPKLAGEYHVYGITRRGFGASAYAGSDYGADRLGDDVVAVLDALKLVKPVLVGHSIAGEELSSVASRYPNRIAGVVYLDAAYPYAFDNGKGAAMSEFQGNLPRPPAPGPADLASFSAYAKWNAHVLGFALPESELRQIRDATPDGGVGKGRIPPGASGMRAGMKKYTAIPVPALVIFAVPHDPGPWIKASTDPAVKEAAKTFATLEIGITERQAKAIEEAVPTAHIARLAGASHLVFLSNEADVLREMRAFLRGLGNN
jgi:non-heme chloroperoxidase